MVGQLWPQGAPMPSGPAGGPVLDVDFSTLTNLDQFDPWPHNGQTDMSDLALGYGGLYNTRAGTGNNARRGLVTKEKYLNTIQLATFHVAWDDTSGGTSAFAYLYSRIQDPPTESWVDARLQKSGPHNVNLTLRDMVDGTSSNSTAQARAFMRDTTITLMSPVIGTASTVGDARHAAAYPTIEGVLDNHNNWPPGTHTLTVGEPGFCGITLDGSNALGPPNPLRLLRWQIWSLD